MTSSRLLREYIPALTAAATAATLVGCATPVTQRVAIDADARAREAQIQQTLAIQEQARMEWRLWSVSYAVMKGAASECGERVRPSLGFIALTPAMYKPEMRDAVARALNLSPLPRVNAVFKGGAAEAAGLQVGDVFQDLSSPALPQVKETPEAQRSRLSGPVEVTVQRNGTPVKLKMTPDTICGYLLVISPQGEVNAFADGERILVSRGMMRFATDDRELALVVGHELGHNVMGHLTKRKQNMAVGALFDIAAAAYGVNTGKAFMNAGATVYSQDFEAEADHVGLYYLARAGYDTQGAANFWRRMAAEHPGSIKANHAATHPPTPERFLALEQVSSDIQSKQSAGLELVPPRKQ